MIGIGSGYMVEDGRNWTDPRIKVRDSPIHGKGMFATDIIKKGELLLIWKESYTDRAGAMEAVKEGKGIMQWDDDIFSVETEANPDDYGINHSCDPNCWMRNPYSVEARRGIEMGEEITIDMAMFEADEDSVAEWNCNCGSPLCRGKVTGKDWRIKELQDRYKGHFSPLIEKRIGSLRNMES